ncbi:transposon, En/Spm-like, transposase-associated domain protein [Tanacetum coccineum]
MDGHGETSSKRQSNLTVPMDFDDHELSLCCPTYVDDIEMVILQHFNRIKIHMSQKIVQTRLNRESRNFAPEIPCSLKIDNRLSIFKVPSWRLFGGKSKVLSGDEMHKIHTYVLLNYVELLADIHGFVLVPLQTIFMRLCYIPTGRLCWLKKVQISDSFATTQQQSWINKSLFKFDDSIRETEPSIEDGELDRRREALFASWFNTNVMLASDGSNAHLKCLAQFSSTNVICCKGYLINGYKFHTQTTYGGRVTQNSGVCVKGVVSDQHESDYYGLLDEIIEVEYDSDLGRCVVVLFKCTWFDPVQGVKVDKKNGMVDIKHTKKGCLDDLYILALQAKQVYYTPYPCTKDWWAVVKTSPKGVFELEEDISEVEDDDNHVGDDFFQENERLICTTDISDHIEPFNLAQGDVEEVPYNIDDDTNDDDVEEDEFQDIIYDEL